MQGPRHPQQSTWPITRFVASRFGGLLADTSLARRKTLNRPHLVFEGDSVNISFKPNARSIQRFSPGKREIALASLTARGDKTRNRPHALDGSARA